MASGGGLYQDRETVWWNSSNAGDPWVATADFDVIGMLIYSASAAATTVNVSVFPTSQQGGPGLNANVVAYDMWTTANAPTIVPPNTTNLAVEYPGLIQNQPYPLNYPLPGPAGTTGFITAQQTALTAIDPVLAPPTVYKYRMAPYVPPDNTYTDYNGIVGVPASFVHQGDVLTLVGSADSVELFLSKR